MEKTKRSAWTRKDEAFVRENPNMAPAKIAGLLGRTVQAIAVRKSKLRTTGTKHFAPQGGRKANSPQMEIEFGAATTGRYKGTVDRYPHTYVGAGITVRSAHKLGWLTKTLLKLDEG